MAPEKTSGFPSRKARDCRVRLRITWWSEMDVVLASTRVAKEAVSNRSPSRILETSAVNARHVRGINNENIIVVGPQSIMV